MDDYSPVLTAALIKKHVAKSTWCSRIRVS